MIGFLPGAACREGPGFRAHDDYMTGHASVAKAKAAVSVCWRCPARRECGARLIEQEHPAGSWPGIFAGLTPVQRLQEFGPMSRGERALAAASYRRGGEGGSVPRRPA